MTDLRRIAVCKDYPALHQALRDRLDELGISMDTLGAIADVANVDKLLAPMSVWSTRKGNSRRVARALGPNTLGPLLWGLGLVIVLAEDPINTARIRRDRLFVCKDRGKVHAQPLCIDGLLRHRQRAALQEIGAKGGRNSRLAIGPLRSREIARNAARARWRKKKSAP